MESSTNKTTMLHADKESGCQTSALNQRRDALQFQELDRVCEV